MTLLLTPFVIDCLNNSFIKFLFCFLVKLFGGVVVFNGGNATLNDFKESVSFRFHVAKIGYIFVQRCH